MAEELTYKLGCLNQKRKIFGIGEMVKANRKFVEAFNLCMQHYGVTGEELEFEKSRVRANYKEAEKCYLAIAEDIKIIQRSVA